MGVRALIVLDTHVWIWWQAAPSRLSRSAARLIADSGEIGVSAASCYELARLVARKRLKLDRPTGEWIRRALAEDRVRELPVSARIASTAGEVDDHFPGDPLDRLITPGRSRTARAS